MNEGINPLSYFLRKNNIKQTGKKRFLGHFKCIPVWPTFRLLGNRGLAVISARIIS
jgi:hypothetical protein